jgi:hypothetical protein
MTSEAERTGVLVVRIWIESASGPLRARVTRTLDVEGGEETSQVAATAEQILRLVRDWIEAFLSAGG